MGGRRQRLPGSPPRRPMGPAGSRSSSAAASTPIAEATAGSGRRYPVASGTTSTSCWAPNPAGRRPAAAATGRPPRRPSSASPAGASTTATNPIPTAPTATAQAAAATAPLAAKNAMAARRWQKGAAHGPAPQPQPRPRPRPRQGRGRPGGAGHALLQGNGLSVRALTAEELQQFLDAHADQPTEPLDSGWAAPDRPGHPLTVPRTPPGAEPAPPQPQPVLPATGSLGHPGRSALTHYRRRCATERAAWTRSLTWRAPLVAAAGLAAGALAAQAGLPRAGLVSLAAAGLVGWRLRFRPPARPAPGSAAPPASATPPGCWTASAATAT